MVLCRASAAHKEVKHEKGWIRDSAGWDVGCFVAAVNRFINT
jgi:hypothetical protein